MQNMHSQERMSNAKQNKAQQNRMYLWACLCSSVFLCKLGKRCGNECQKLEATPCDQREVQSPMGMPW